MRYRSRQVTPLGVEAVDGWRLPRRELVTAAVKEAALRCRNPPVSEVRYGVGFSGIHDGRGGNFVFVDWWEHENEPHHHVFFSSTDEPVQLRAANDTDPSACVWDLCVVGHEREAWVRYVLANPVALIWTPIWPTDSAATCKGRAARALAHVRRFERVRSNVRIRPVFAVAGE